MNQRDAPAEDLAIHETASGRGPRQKELANIVNDQNIDLLFCMLTAGAFALAVARTIALLWFS